MYSTHNEQKSVVFEKFIRILKQKTFRYMISRSKNVYVDKLDDIVNTYNNTYRKTMEMNLADTTSSTYIHCDGTRTHDHLIRKETLNQ